MSEKPALPNSLPSSITCLRRGRATHPKLMLMGLCSMAPHVCRAACRVRVLRALFPLDARAAISYPHWDENIA